MKHKDRQYILQHIDKKTPQEIASDLGIKERTVIRFIETLKKKGKDTVAKNAAHASAVSFSIKTVLAVFILLAIIGFAVYGNSLQGKFVYDDRALIKDNAYIKDWHYLPEVFAKSIGKGAGKEYNFYRPTQVLTYMIDHSFWKLNPVGYHITNILLHILVALCIYLFIQILYDKPALSLLTAIFFLVHPIHTSITSHISSRAESLYLIFLLLAFILYIKTTRGGGAANYSLMMLFYILAFLSKENSLILPALILLYHYTFRKKIRLPAFLSLIGLVIIYASVRMMYLQLSSPSIMRGTTLLERLPGFFIAMANYARLLLLPFNLHNEYGADTFSPTDPGAICGAAIVLILLFCILRTARAKGQVFFGLSFFFIALIPTSNLFFPINAFMAENWLYLPSIGFFLILSHYLTALYENERFKKIALVLIATLAIFYSVLTIIQNNYWREPVEFYKRTLKYAPTIAKLWNNLGTAYDEAGNREEAVKMYKKALELDPNEVLAYNNLGIAYDDMGNTNEAIAMYRKAIELSPGYADAYNNLGALYQSRGNMRDAIASYKGALKLNPDQPASKANLENILNEAQSQITLYKKAIDENPDDINAYIMLGKIYYDFGKDDEAVAALKKAIEVRPGSAEAYNYLGNVYAGMGKKDDAIAIYNKALEIKPDYADAYNNLGSVYSGMGRKDEAISLYKKAIECDARHAIAYDNLSRIYYDRKEYDEMLKYYDKAVEAGFIVSPEIMKNLEAFRRKKDSAN